MLFLRNRAGHWPDFSWIQVFGNDCEAEPGTCQCLVGTVIVGLDGSLGIATFACAIALALLFSLAPIGQGIDCTLGTPRDECRNGNLGLAQQSALVLATRRYLVLV